MRSFPLFGAWHARLATPMDVYSQIFAGYAVNYLTVRGRRDDRVTYKGAGVPPQRVLVHRKIELSPRHPAVPVSELPARTNHHGLIKPPTRPLGRLPRLQGFAAGRRR